MDINSVIESFAEAFVAANTVTPLTAPEGTVGAVVNAATAATSPHLLCSGDSQPLSSQGKSPPTTHYSLFTTYITYTLTHNTSNSLTDLYLTLTTHTDTVTV